MLVKVKNLVGTSDNYPPFGYSSWKEYWMMAKGYWPSKCSANGCLHSADVGAHVKLANSIDNHWYIVPLCSHHNQCSGEFYAQDYLLVPVRR